MKRIYLINMPFAALEYPSLALTQLKFILDKNYKHQIKAEILYMNHCFSRFLGLEHYRQIDTYNWIGDSYQTGMYNYGIGEWMFKSIAIDTDRNNDSQYIARYFSGHETFIAPILKKQEKLDEYLETLIDDHQLHKSDMVGFTSMFQQQMPSLSLARKIKKRNPRVITFMGGPNCDYPRNVVYINNTDYIDYIFSGPSLNSFNEFIQYYLKGSLENNVHRIAGIAYRGTKNTLPFNEHNNNLYGSGNDINEIDALDYTDYLYSIEKYYPSREIRPVLPFETSRGCYWAEKNKCLFCAVNGNTSKYDAMKPETAIRLFKHLNQYVEKCIGYRAVDSVIPPDYAHQVFDKLHIPDSISVYYQVRADLRRNELARSGVNILQAGIESLTTEHLQLMNKGSTGISNIYFLKLCAEYNISLIWNLLFSVPFETDAIYEYYIDILPLLYHLPPPTNLLPINYSEFNHYKEHAKHYGLKLEAVDELLEFLYCFPKEDLNKLVYFYRIPEHMNTISPRRQTLLKSLSKIIMRWRSKWDRQRKPMLYMDKDHNIHDLRKRVKEVQCTSQLEYSLLESTYDLISLEEIYEYYYYINKNIINNCIHTLVNNGYIIRENNMILNLLLKELK